MNRLIFSKFTHIFEKEKMVAYYNSLKLNPIFVEKEFREILSCFENGYNPQKFLSKIDDVEIKDMLKSLLKSLIEQKILLRHPSEDEKEKRIHLAKISKPYIHVAFFLLTNDCNYACKYCFVREPMSSNFKTMTMTKEIALKGLDLYTRLIHQDEDLIHQEKVIVFYGGEPLMNFPVLQFTIEKIEQYRQQEKLPRHLKLLMVTNGSLITEEKADFLKKHNVTVTFSIDGDEKENLYRILSNGKPGFSSTVRGYKICQEKGLDINIACTLTPQNVSEGEKTIKSFAEYYKVKRIGFNMLLDNGITTVPDWYNKKASEFIIKAHNIFRKKGIRENRMTRKLEAFNKSKVYLYDCMAGGGRQMAIAPDGGIGICHEDTWNQKNYVTNVNETNFNPAKSAAYLEWANRTPLKMDQCQSCFALGICGGGCLINAKYKGSIWEIDERFCVQSKTILEWMIWNLYESLVV
ncbi:anaerobic sulfatase-maturating enzyme [bacterium BMS3Abin03]|nr:anaerobic sulfatase-maturating enzyme [bacterium BMS3Abin03]